MQLPGNTRVKRVPKEKLQQEIEDYIVSDWRLKSQDENGAILTKPGGNGSAIAHILVFLLFGWYTLCIANILYIFWCNLTHGEKLIIKVDGTYNEPVTSAKLQSSRCCPNCSNENLNSAKFCSKCGHSLEVSNPQELQEKTRQSIEARPEKTTETKEEMLPPQKPQEIIGSKNASN